MLTTNHYNYHLNRAQWPLQTTSSTKSKGMQFPKMLNAILELPTKNLIGPTKSAIKALKAHKHTVELTNLLTRLKNPRISEEVLLNEFQKLPKNIQEFFYICIWASHGKPQGDPQYAQRQIEKNPRILLSTQNSQHQNIVEQVINHYRGRESLDTQSFKLKKFAALLENSGSISLRTASEAYSKLDPFLKHLLTIQARSKLSIDEAKISENPLILIQKNLPGNLSICDSVINALEHKARHKITYAKKNLLASKAEQQQGHDISAERLQKKLPSNVLEKPVRALFITAESSNVLKQGGLAEAVYGMAEGLVKQNPGSKVRMIMPKYNLMPKSLQDKLIEKPELAICDKYKGGKVNRVFKANINDVKFYFIEDTPSSDNSNSHRDHFSIAGFDSKGKPKGIYDENDLITKDRFAYFSSAAAELAYKLKNKADVIHLHDWHTAPVANLLPRRHPEEWKEGSIPPVVFTYHNNQPAAQGTYNYEETLQTLRDIGIYEGPMNMFTQALLDSDAITTVSETFAKESETVHLGFNANNEVLKAANKDKVTGILNGSNPSSWDPSTDAQLKYWKDPETGQPIDLTYGPGDNLIAKKALIKDQIQKWLKINRPDLNFDCSKPLVTFIGRYDASQKGLDMLLPAMEATLANGGQFISMGSQENGDRARGILDNLDREAREKGGALIVRDSQGPDGRYMFQQGSHGRQGLGSLVRAASDFVLVPSEFEPCGLVQFEGWLFGSLAIGTKTGGLADSIKMEGPQFNGFLFDRKELWLSQEQKDAVKETVRKALQSWSQKTDAEKQALMRKVMDQGRKSSWTTAVDGLSPIEKYRYVYEDAARQAQWRGKALVNPTLLMPPRITV